MKLLPVVDIVVLVWAVAMFTMALQLRGCDKRASIELIIEIKKCEDAGLRAVMLNLPTRIECRPQVEK